MHSPTIHSASGSRSNHQVDPVRTDASTPSPPSALTRAVKKLIVPALFAAVLASSATGVVPALKAYRRQATRMPEDQMAKYLPKPNDRLFEASGIMIHNAGSDVARSDTLLFYTNQHQSTVDILNSVPALGAQMDPYKVGDEWFLRHQKGDGSSPLRLVDELNEITAWLDNNPQRIFVLDLDTHKRLSSNDSSLAQTIQSTVGERLLLNAQGVIGSGTPYEAFMKIPMKAVISSTKHFVLTDRASSITGFENVSSFVTVNPLNTYASNLTPGYSLARGFPKVDHATFTVNQGIEKDHLETPADIAKHVQEPSTQVLLDQLNLASLIEPQGLESDPVLISYYPANQWAREATLAATTGAAIVGAMAALAAAAMVAKAIQSKTAAVVEGPAAANLLARQNLPKSVASAGLQATLGLSNSLLTLASVFPGLRNQAGFAGVGMLALGLAATAAAYKANHSRLNTRTEAAPSNTVQEAVDLEMQALDTPVDLTMGSTTKWMSRLSEAATTYHVLTRFSSLSKYETTTVLPTLAFLNAAAMASQLVIKMAQHHSHVSELVRNPPTYVAQSRVKAQNQIQRDIHWEGAKGAIQVANLIGSAGVYAPAVPAYFMTSAALQIAVTGTLTFSFAWKQIGRIGPIEMPWFRRMIACCSIS